MFWEKIYQSVNTIWLLLTGKHLCWSLFLTLGIALKRAQSTDFEEHLQAAAYENVFIKSIHKEI